MPYRCSINGSGLSDIVVCPGSVLSIEITFSEKLKSLHFRITDAKDGVRLSHKVVPREESYLITYRFPKSAGDSTWNGIIVQYGLSGHVYEEIIPIKIRKEFNVSSSKSSPEESISSVKQDVPRRKSHKVDEDVEISSLSPKTKEDEVEPKDSPAEMTANSVEVEGVEDIKSLTNDSNEALSEDKGSLDDSLNGTVSQGEENHSEIFESQIDTITETSNEEVQSLASEEQELDEQTMECSPSEPPLSPPNSATEQLEAEDSVETATGTSSSVPDISSQNGNSATEVDDETISSDAHVDDETISSDAHGNDETISSDAHVDDLLQKEDPHLSSSDFPNSPSTEIDDDQAESQYPFSSGVWNSINSVSDLQQFSPPPLSDYDIEELSIPVNELEELGPVDNAELKEAGLSFIFQLLQSDPTEIHKITSADPSRIAYWYDQALVIKDDVSHPLRVEYREIRDREQARRQRFEQLKHVPQALDFLDALDIDEESIKILGRNGIRIVKDLVLANFAEVVSLGFPKSTVEKWMRAAKFYIGLDKLDRSMWE